jgi:HTH-type transcriptional regulator / antitoxin HigA
MATRTKARATSKVADSYLNLVLTLPLASIKSGAQYQRAQAMIDRLVTKRKLDRGERMYLDALSDLLAAYEDIKYPVPAASDADMLRHLLDAKNVSDLELHRRTGIPKGAIADILAGKKPFTRPLVRTLSRFFKVDPTVLSSHL